MIDPLYVDCVTIEQTEFSDGSIKVSGGGDSEVYLTPKVIRMLADMIEVRDQ